MTRPDSDEWQRMAEEDLEEWAARFKRESLEDFLQVMSFVTFVGVAVVLFWWWLSCQS